MVALELPWDDNQFLFRKGALVWQSAILNDSLRRFAVHEVVIVSMNTPRVHWRYLSILELKMRLTFHCSSK